MLLDMHALKHKFFGHHERIHSHDIIHGLKALSKYIPQDPSYKGLQIPIVVSGGTCSVLFLKSRKSTLAIDYFTCNPDHIQIIGDAARMANRRETARHPYAWMNPDMLGFVANNEGCETVFDDSVRQGEVLFESPSLVVYAADWRFQLVGKMQRAYADADDEAQQDDLADAVSILHLLVQRRGGDSIAKEELRRWYSYGLSMEEAEFALVATAYKARHGVVPFV
ncbi:hypothetical protein BKA62DRAFT_655516 [Auriculariales sp. MPI-PUGE-AT-0066]|nr:hypothetical protein BKA62DRAFT_655516 [Auriculariales sp. MPI-PUGE-AT-0066]